mmetsp:Transcript_5642/g.12365  ORF Transcript_5642/g.12365 Transcript_5642/m.12365 type:complete len:235 (+) Transcript_5642:209-913(+)
MRSANTSWTARPRLADTASPLSMATASRPASSSPPRAKAALGNAPLTSASSPPSTSSGGRLPLSFLQMDALTPLLLLLLRSSPRSVVRSAYRSNSCMSSSNFFSIAARSACIRNLCRSLRRCFLRRRCRRFCESSAAAFLSAAAASSSSSSSSCLRNSRSIASLVTTLLSSMRRHILEVSSSSSRSSSVHKPPSQSSPPPPPSSSRNTWSSYLLHTCSHVIPVIVHLPYRRQDL